MELFKQAIESYKEKTYPLVGLDPNPQDHSCDNGLLFSATYLVNNPSDKEYSDTYFDIVNKCQVPNEPGLYYRYPNFRDLNAFDDLTGISVVSSMYGTPHAKFIYEHGKRNKWSWNSEFPNKWTKEAFFGRIPSFVAGVKAAAGIKLNIFDVFFSSVAYIYDCFVDKGETNGRCLLYLRKKVLGGKSIFLDLAIKIWENSMMKKYPDGLKGLYTIYFKDHHPLTQFAKGDFK